MSWYPGKWLEDWLKKVGIKTQRDEVIRREASQLLRQIDEDIKDFLKRIESRLERVKYGPAWYTTRGLELLYAAVNSYLTGAYKWRDKADKIEYIGRLLGDVLCDLAEAAGLEIE